MNIYLKKTIYILTAIVWLCIANNVYSKSLGTDEVKINQDGNSKIIEVPRDALDADYTLTLRGENDVKYCIGDCNITTFSKSYDNDYFEITSSKIRQDTVFFSDITLTIKLKQALASKREIKFVVNKVVNTAYTRAGEYKITFNIPAKDKSSGIDNTALTTISQDIKSTNVFLKLIVLLAVLLLGVMIYIFVKVSAYFQTVRKEDKLDKETQAGNQKDINRIYREQVAEMTKNISAIASSATELKEEVLATLKSSMQDNRDSAGPFFQKYSEPINESLKSIGEATKAIRDQHLVGIENSLQILINNNKLPAAADALGKLSSIFNSGIQLSKSSVDDLSKKITISQKDHLDIFAKIIDEHVRGLNETITSLGSVVNTQNRESMIGIQNAFQNAAEIMASAASDIKNVTKITNDQGPAPQGRATVPFSQSIQIYENATSKLSSAIELLTQQSAIGDDIWNRITDSLNTLDKTLKSHLSVIPVHQNTNISQNGNVIESAGTDLASMNRFFKDIETEINRLSIAEIFDVSDAQLLIKERDNKLNIASKLTKDIEDIIKTLSNLSLLRNVNLHTAELSKRHVALKDIAREINEIISSFDKGAESTAFGKLLSLIRGNKKINALKIKCEDALKDTETEKIAMIIRNIASLIDDEIYDRKLSYDGISKINGLLTNIFEVVTLKPINPQTSDMLNLYEHDVIAEENISGVARGYVAKTKRRGFYLNNTVRWKAEVVVAK